MYFVEDENFARQLQNEYQAYESFRKEKEVKEKENSNLVDSNLEYIDPTPSIHDLFMNFNRKFFWNALGMVEVVWSHRMTTCAGLCSFEGGRGLCKISLSAPLLSLRPRKDLVETLLHEMIHAYLFVTHNYKDRDDHGPEFHKHMFRINKEAGTKITVYHTFYHEVEYYQRHIWRCDGPCQKKKPYFGFVRRAMNRPPGPNDPWWDEHKRQCGGTFTKISEPEKEPKKRKKIIVVKPGEKHKDIREYFSQKGTSQTNIDNQNKSNIRTLADLKEKPAAGLKTNAGTGTVVVTNTNKENSKTKKPIKSTVKKNAEKVKVSETEKTKSSQNKGSSFLSVVKGKPAVGLKTNAGTGTVVVTNTNKENSKTKKPIKSTGKKNPEKVKVSETEQTKSSQNKSSPSFLANLKKPAAGLKTNAGTRTAAVTNTNKENSKTKKPIKSTGKKNPEKVKVSETEQTKSSENKGGEKGSSSDEIREIVRSKWADKFTNTKPVKDPSPKKMKMDCPVCGEGFSEEMIENHVDECLKTESCGEEMKESSIPETTSSEQPDEHKKCPVCSGKILQSEMNTHLESCLRCKFVNEEDNELDSEVTCESVPCPCCYKWFQESEMNSHIDDCLTLITLKEEILAS